MPLVPPPSRLRLAHFYQEGSARFSEPQAAHLHIYHTIRGLQQAGHQVALFALQGRRVLFTHDLNPFTTYPLPDYEYAAPGLSGAPLFRGVESAVRRLQSSLRMPYLALFDSYRMAEVGGCHLAGYDLIHERFNLLAMGGTWASRRLGIPLVLEVNADLLAQRAFKGTPERGPRRLFALWATRSAFNQASKIICISAGLKEHLRNRWKIAESKLAVLPCAADVEAFRPEHPSKSVREALGLSTEPVVIWVGGFYPWHDLDLLLGSFSQLLQSQPDARLLLVGDGPTRPTVEQKLSNSGLRHAVIMTGAVPHSGVPELLSVADVAVVPAAPVSASRGGTGTPLKLFEYMAAGKAIVATALNQAADVIRDDHNGRLVPAGDVHGFAEAMRTLLEEPQERGRLGQNARREAVARYSWEAYTERLEESYRDVLAHASPRSPST